MQQWHRIKTAIVRHCKTGSQNITENLIQIKCEYTPFLNFAETDTKIPPIYMILRSALTLPILPFNDHGGGPGYVDVDTRL